MKKIKLKFELIFILIVFFSFSECLDHKKNFDVKIACELSGADITEIGVFTLSLYKNLDSKTSLEESTQKFCAGWDQPVQWDPVQGENPTGAVFYDSRTGSTLSNGTSFNFELNPGRWGFTFVAKKSSSEEKDLYRGCTVADLVEGPNPQVKIYILEIQWPIPQGYCGNGIVEQNELCDDGNTEDDVTCSSDCNSMPVFQVNTVTPGSQYEPSIAGSSGVYAISWTSSGSYQAGESSIHVRARRVDLYGRGMKTGIYEGDVDFRLNTVSDQGQFQPSTAMGINRFMTAWVDNAPTTTSGDIVWRFTDFDNVFTNVEQAFSDKTDTQNWVKLAGNGGTKFLATWIKSTDDQRCRYSIYDTSGSGWSSAADCSATSSSGETLSEAAMDISSNKMAVAWSRNGGIFVQFLDEQGNRLGDEKRVDTRSGGFCDYPSLAFDGEGKLLVVWRFKPAAGNIEIAGRIFDSNHNPVGDSDFKINTTPLDKGAGVADNPNYVPDVAGDPVKGIFLVVWDAPEAGGGRARIVLGNNQFGINRFTRGSQNEPFTSTDDFTFLPQEPNQMDQLAVACADENMCMVVWSDQSGISDMEVKGVKSIVIPTLQP